MYMFASLYVCLQVSVSGVLKGIYTLHFRVGGIKQKSILSFDISIKWNQHILGLDESD